MDIERSVEAAEKQSAQLKEKGLTSKEQVLKIHTPAQSKINMINKVPAYAVEHLDIRRETVTTRMLSALSMAKQDIWQRSEGPDCPLTLLQITRNQVD